jgi:hypothetical protein
MRKTWTNEFKSWSIDSRLRQSQSQRICWKKDISWRMQKEIVNLKNMLRKSSDESNSLKCSVLSINSISYTTISIRSSGETWESHSKTSQSTNIFNSWTIAKTSDDLWQHVIISQIFHETLISSFNQIPLSDFTKIVLIFSSINLDSITEINRKIRRTRINHDLFSISIKAFRDNSIDIKTSRSHSWISNRIRELNRMTFEMLQRLSCRHLLNILRENRHSNQISDRIDLLLFKTNNNSRESIIRTNLRMCISTSTTRNSKKTSESSMMIRNHTTINPHIIMTTNIMTIDHMRKFWNLQRRRRQKTFKAQSLTTFKSSTLEKCWKMIWHSSRSHSISSWNVVLATWNFTSTTNYTSICARVNMKRKKILKERIHQMSSTFQ